MTTLTEFKNHLSDIVRSNRFLISFEGPVSSLVSNKIQYFTSKGSLPKRDVTGPVIKYRGTSLTLAGDYKQEPLVLTFINDAEWVTRTFFEDWLDSLTKSGEENIKSSLDTNRFGNNIIIDQLGPDPTISLAKYKFYEIIPLDISEIDLDTTAQDTFEEFTLSFHYSHWKRIATNFQGNQNNAFFGNT